MGDGLERRLDRVESELAIRQLAARYALAVDGRDLDALVALFSPDVDCGRWGAGREALAAYYRSTLARFGRSIHLVCGHVIEPAAGDRAGGVVYCRAEHEAGDEWIVQTFAYFDEYERAGGEWYFRRRRLRTWYAGDITERPSGPDFVRWEMAGPGRLPDELPTWDAFWAATPGSG